jgi:surface antigen
MRASVYVALLVAAMCTAFAVVSFVVPGAEPPLADETATSSADATWPAGARDVNGQNAYVEPALRGGASPSAPDGIDEIAVLEAVHLALTEVPDGATYLWQRRGGGVRGTVRLTSSFLDPGARVCRHLVLVVVRGPTAKRTEGIACREPDRSWTLGG